MSIYKVTLLLWAVAPVTSLIPLMWIFSSFEISESYVPPQTILAYSIVGSTNELYIVSTEWRSNLNFNGIIKLSFLLALTQISFMCWLHLRLRENFSPRYIWSGTSLTFCSFNQTDGFKLKSFLLLIMSDFVLGAENVTSHLFAQCWILFRSWLMSSAVSSWLSTSMNRQVSSAKSCILQCDTTCVMSFMKSILKMKSMWC